MTVGQRIRARREELGLTQTELALQMGYSGKSSVSEAEKCGDNITTTKVRKFADALGVSFRYLMGLEDNEPAIAVTEPGTAYMPWPPNDLDEESMEFAHLFQDASEEERALVMAYLKKKQPKT